MKYLVGGQNTVSMTIYSQNGSTGGKMTGRWEEKVLLAPAVLLGACNHKSLCHVSADKEESSLVRV